MSKRALLIALITAVLGAALLLLYIRRFEQEASGGEPISLLVVTKPIEPGTVLTDDMLNTREVPVKYVEDRAVKAPEQAKVVGLRLGTKLRSQQTLMWTDLALTTDEQRDLSSLVQPGNRAVSLTADRGDKSLALVRPGDYVDVIATMPTAGDKSAAIVLIQKVLVLAVGLDTASEQIIGLRDPKDRDLILTLSVDLKGAQLLALAREKGKLSVALRNPDDLRVVEKLPDMPSSALFDPEVRAPVQQVRSGPTKLGGRE